MKRLPTPLAHPANRWIAALGLGSALVWGGLLRGAPPLRFTAIDVGQGDSMLVETPDGAAMLVDGGGHPGAEEAAAAECEIAKSIEGSIPLNAKGIGSIPLNFDVGERIVVPFLRRHGIRRLDVVVLTHPHDDHVGGLGAVLETFPVRLVLENGERTESPAFKRFARAIVDRKIPCRAVAAGDAFRLGRETDVEVLGPLGPRFQGTHSDLNNGSVVLKLQYHRFTALLTGDIEHEAEERLMPRFGPVDLLKVAHHGSRFSTSDTFVGRTRPEVAVISVGEHNVFGHPSPDVVERLERSGARVYRTDRDGAVTVETDGDTIRESAYRSRRDGAAQPTRSAAIRSTVMIK